jgi:hypothetical protein
MMRTRRWACGNLDARTVDLVLEGRLAEALDRFLDVRRGARSIGLWGREAHLEARGAGPPHRSAHLAGNLPGSERNRPRVRTASFFRPAARVGVHHTPFRAPWSHLDPSAASFRKRRSAASARPGISRSKWSRGGRRAGAMAPASICEGLVRSARVRGVPSAGARREPARSGTPLTMGPGGNVRSVGVPRGHSRPGFTEAGPAMSPLLGLSAKIQRPWWTDFDERGSRRAHPQYCASPAPTPRRGVDRGLEARLGREGRLLQMVALLGLDAGGRPQSPTRRVAIFPLRCPGLKRHGRPARRPRAP